MGTAVIDGYWRRWCSSKASDSEGENPGVGYRVSGGGCDARERDARSETMEASASCSPLVAER